MLNKLKNYIRNKLGKFLGIDDLINLFDKHIDNNNSNFCDIERDFNLIKKSIDVLHNTMESISHVGTDVDTNNSSHSWAVVCIEGKINIVKFVDLSNRDAKDIYCFLKDFEGARHCIDAPSKDIFYNALFKFEKIKEQ